MTREIGSEFEMPNPDLLTSAKGALLPPDALLVGAGRHALTLVASDLLTRGVSTVVVPDHYCESMILPFLSVGMNLVFCGTTDELLLSGPSLAAILHERSDQLAILHSETFGSPATEELQSVLDFASQSHIPIILDRTHSLLSPPPPATEGLYEIASLRKLLPVPDGGYVRGLRSEPALAETPEHQSFVELRRRAAEQKSRYLDQVTSDKSYLDRFSDAEQILDKYVRPAKISDHSQAMLELLDLNLIRNTRIANAQALEAALAPTEIGFANTAGWRNSPAYLVISHPNVRSLRAHLLSNQIYCPVHWPYPAGPPRPREWRTDLLSLPIDHRYNAGHMQRIASIVVDFQEMNTK